MHLSTGKKMSFKEMLKSRRAGKLYRLRARLQEPQWAEVLQQHIIVDTSNHEKMCVISLGFG